MPPENFGTISAAALLAGIGAMTSSSGCFSSGDDIIDVSSEAGGADYGGPEGNEFNSDEVFETDEAEATSDSSSSSSSESTTESTGATDTTTESTTGEPALCGWDATNGYYECGFEGADPGGTPIECPAGLVEGDPCETTGLTGAGCCDANGANWYCTQEGTVFFNDCVP
jgi:hypothetical protein